MHENVSRLRTGVIPRMRTVAIQVFGHAPVGRRSLALLGVVPLTSPQRTYEFAREWMIACKQ
jgi:hypothetical protein